MAMNSLPPPNSLLARLIFWADHHPTATAVIYLADGERVQERISYGELLARVDGIAVWLRTHVAPGERVLVAAHSEVHYLLSLLACLRAGVVAIPTLASVNARALERMQAHGEDAKAVALLADTWVIERRERGRVANTDLWIDGIPWLNVEEEPSKSGRVADIAKVTNSLKDPHGVAYLQYTSGSTSSPKGVVITHANLAAQLGDLERVFSHRPGSVVCNWMPLFHDFGLILSLQGLYCGGTLVLMPAVPTVQRPYRWLSALSTYRAVTSAAPNFMFDRCVERIPPEARKGLDLSSLRHLMNGAEPIQAGSLQTFNAYFHAYGFQESACLPAYGLAEATLVVSIGVPGKKIVTQKFSAEALLERRAVLHEGMHPYKELVGCGEALVPDSVRVVDPDSGRPSHADEIGEIWLTSPSVADGYWEPKSETDDTFLASLADVPDGRHYLRTGDLGFIWQDQLFVSGRLKDLVIVRGENHYPQDIELTVVKSHPDLEPNAGAVFAIDSASGEALVIVQEVRREMLQRIVPEALFASIRRAVAENHGLDSAHIILLRPAGLPRTSSGKVQRRECRQRWQNGTLPIVMAWAATNTVDVTPEDIAVNMESEIVSICRTLLGNMQIFAQTNLFDCGVDSLKASEILLAIEERWEVVMDLADFAAHPTAALLATAIGVRQETLAPARQEEAFVLGDIVCADDNTASSRDAEGVVSQIRQYVGTWGGERATPESLLVGRNVRGKKCPLFWVFQGEQEFIALADRLGVDQPVYGFRSGHQVMTYSEANIQMVATHYRREITAIYPHGDFILGGNCQGGLIALAIAQQFLRLQRSVALLALLEWAFPPQPYQGRVALFWGESSLHKNPYFKFHEPQHYWNRAFGAHCVDIVSGGHGEFFAGKNLHVLADKLNTRMGEALALPQLFLPQAAFRVAYRAIDPPRQMGIHQLLSIEVEIKNTSTCDWDSTGQSGLKLGNHWRDNADSVVSWLDGVAPLPTLKSGSATTLTIAIRAPAAPGEYCLQLDLVEEGIAWFSERGVTPLTLKISVV